MKTTQCECALSSEVYIVTECGDTTMIFRTQIGDIKPETLEIRATLL